MTSYECYMAVGCGACGVEINPNYLIAAQYHALSNPGTPCVDGLSPRDIASCGDFPPVDPGPPSTNGSPWYDPANPLSAMAFGIVIHEVTVTDPNEISGAQRSKLAADGCVVTGNRLGYLKAEAVGVNKAATQWLADRVAQQLMGGKRCCGQNMEVFRHCCTIVYEDENGDPKTISGRRTLTDVRRFYARCSDDQTDRMTTCGTVFEVDFLAGDEIREPDSIQCADLELLGPICLPECPPQTTEIERTTLRARRQCNGDLVRGTDGVVRFCPVDFDLAAYNPDECFLAVRDVRSEAQPEEPCCPPEVGIEVQANGSFDVVPLQPDLWAEMLADGFSCACQPVVRWVRIPNPDFDPDCPACFVNGENVFWATESGLTFGADGFLNLPASTAALTQFGICIGAFEALDAGSVAINTTQGTYSVTDDSGETQTSAFPYSPASQKPLTRITEGHGVELPLPCMEFIEFAPSGSGPCITITRDGNTFEADVDLSANDLTSASFRWDPCADEEAGLCDAVVPPDPCINLDGLEAEGLNLVFGEGWPGSDIPGSSYTIKNLDGAPNTADPIEVTETVTVPVSAAACEPACGELRDIRPAEVAGSCWPDCVDMCNMDLWVAPITGLSPSTTYRPIWNVTAEQNTEFVHIQLASGLPFPPSNDEDVLRSYFCGTENQTVRLLRIPAGERFSVETGAPCITCHGQPENALRLGYVDGSRGQWETPTICGVTDAYLLVAAPCYHPLKGRLCLEPVVTK